MTSQSESELFDRATAAYRMLDAFISRGEYEADVRELLNVDGESDDRDEPESCEFCGSYCCDGECMDGGL